MNCTNKLEIKNNVGLHARPAALFAQTANKFKSDISIINGDKTGNVKRILNVNVILQAHLFDKWVGLCGELAGEILAIPILFGMRLDEFSMNPPAIPIAKQIIRNLEFPKCKKIAEEVLALESADEVTKYMQEQMPELSE